MIGPNWERNENERKMCSALEKVAKEIGAKSIQSGKDFTMQSRYQAYVAHIWRLVAIAYVMQKSPYVFPLIGGRKVEHLMSNLEALDISLTSEHIAYIEGILPFERGNLYTFFVSLSSFLKSICC